MLLASAEAGAPGVPMRGRSPRCRGGLKMKSKRRQARVGDQRLSGNEQVRREIQSFLRALHSYPERFSKDPGITFEEYCSSLVALQTDPRRRG
jgi:hypothetical protein